MLISLMFSYILIIPTIFGKSVDNKDGKNNPTLSVAHNVLQNAFNKTKITVASEGGAIMSNTPALSLPSGDPAIPMTPDNEIGTNKVKARKGAFLNISDDDIDNLSSDIKQNISSIVNQQIENNVDAKLKSNLTELNPQTNISRVHKPAILSAEAIAATDEMTNNDPVSDDVDERNVKIHKINSKGHPDMVMPIVITILVVPMFAVIGYMVLKRGQEAWKNRHYKRMDFLLDGMYND